MMRRRRRRRAVWSFADQGALIVSASNGANIGGQHVAWIWVLPPARAEFIMNTRQRDRLTFAGAHLWLDFNWQVTTPPAQSFPVDFGIIKTTIADPSSFQPDLTQVGGQWDQPATPAALTSWEEDDDDGSDSWLWSHHIPQGSPPNALVKTKDANASPDEYGNQYSLIGQGNGDFLGDGRMCRKFAVIQEWQPDVVVRSKRRLQKGEGILLYMAADNGVLGAGIQANLNVNLRTLTS